jgi:galactokinase
VTVTAEARDGDDIEAHAHDVGETDTFPLDAPEKATGWRAFVRGTVAELTRAGYALKPCELRIEGDLDQGSGLSSSAALEAALALALLGVAGEPEPEDRRDLAKLCSRVENEWVGAQTGLLDQLASLCSEPGHALRIDFRTLELRPVPLDLGDWTLVTIDSGTAHSHAGSGYNERRAECEHACERLGIPSLREATMKDVERLPPPFDRRARHVVTENERVEQMTRALEAGDLPAVADLLNASHRSLRDDYDSSTPEVEETITKTRAAGARMVGGGFGGAVLALMRPGVPHPPGALPVVPGPPAGLV